MLTILQAVGLLIIIAKNASRKIQIGILNFTSSSPGFSGPRISCTKSDHEFRGTKSFAESWTLKRNQFERSILERIKYKPNFCSRELKINLDFIEALLFFSKLIIGYTQGPIYLGYCGPLNTDFKLTGCRL